MGLEFHRQLRINSTTLPDEFETVARSLAGQSVNFLIGNKPAPFWILDSMAEIPFSSFVRVAAAKVEAATFTIEPAFWVRRPPTQVDRYFRIGGALIDSIVTLPWEQLLQQEGRYPPFILCVKTTNNQRTPISDLGGLVEVEIATDCQDVANQVKIWLGGFVVSKPVTTFAYTHELVYFFRPPVQSTTYFPDGVLTKSSELLARLDADPALLNKHALICGQAGYGKSNTTKLLLEKVIKHQPVEGLLVIDLHGEYRDWADRNHVKFVDAGRHPEQLAKLHVNPMVPPRAQRFDTYLELLSVIFSVSAFKGGGVNLPAYMHLLLREFFQRLWNVDRSQLRARLHATGEELIAQGHFAADDGNNLLELLCDDWRLHKAEILKSIAGGHGGANLADLSGAITARMNALEMSLLAFFDFSSSARNIGNLLHQKAVVSLQGASEGDANLIVSLLATVLLETALLRDETKHFRNLIVIEEAHRVMARPSKGSAEFQTATDRLASVLQRAFREVRSRGMGIIAIDQSPHTLIDEAFANTSVKVAHHLTLPADQTLINQVFLTDDLDLSAFDVGECLIKVDANPAYRTRLSLWDGKASLP